MRPFTFPLPEEAAPDERKQRDFDSDQICNVACSSVDLSQKVLKKTNIWWTARTHTSLSQHDANEIL